MESNGGMTLTGETEEFGETAVPMPFCPPQTPYGLTRPLRNCILKYSMYTCFHVSKVIILNHLPNQQLVIYGVAPSKKH
jgi:hypothetical protein